MKNLKECLAYFAILGLMAFNACDKDPCETTVCLNEGTCANGECLCADGYEGADCSQEMAPTLMEISSIEVTKFPGTRQDGSTWDADVEPDIYPEITQGENVIFTTEQYINNADSDNSYTFTASPVAQIESPNLQHDIILYDADDIFADEEMGGITFTPYKSGNGFPEEIVLDADGNVVFTLTVSYTW